VNKVVTIQIQLNGEIQQVPADCTVAQLLQNLEIVTTRIAIEKNQQILPKSQYAKTILIEGDQLEIIQAIGGG
jgi:sulfur carrier protein